MDNYFNLEKSLHTGFINKNLSSSEDLRPSLVINDYNKGKKVLNTIKRELESCDEFFFSVAFITTSGLAVLMNTLLKLEKKNINGIILTSQYLNFTHPEALIRIKKFKNIKIKIAVEGDFHSKGYLFRKKEIDTLIIGSSNLTQSALCSNNELNLKISATENSELIEQFLNRFKIDFDNSTEVTDIYIKDYKLLWESNRKLDEDLLKSNKYKAQLFQFNAKEALDNIESLRKMEVIELYCLGYWYRKDLFICF